MSSHGIGILRSGIGRCWAWHCNLRHVALHVLMPSSRYCSVYVTNYRRNSNSPLVPAAVARSFVWLTS